MKTHEYVIDLLPFLVLAPVVWAAVRRESSTVRKAARLVLAVLAYGLWLVVVFAMTIMTILVVAFSSRAGTIGDDFVALIGLAGVGFAVLPAIVALGRRSARMRPTGQRTI